MALTKPKLSQNIDTDISVFNDPILVLHQGSTTPDIDVGFLMNRSNGLTANAAVIWQESSRSFVHILTNSSGVSDSNLVVQSYANVSVGNVLLINNAGIYVDGTLGNPGQVLASDGSKTFWAAPGGFTGGTVPNPTVFQSNLVISSTTNSTLDRTGALVVLGGASIGGNVTFSGNSTHAGKFIINEATNSEPYIMGSGAFHVAGGMSIGKDFWVGGNLYVANVISQTSEIIQVQDPLVYLRGNNFPYNYDIGVFSDFTGGSFNRNQYTGAVRSYQTNEWVFFSNIDIAPAAGIVGLNNSKIIYDPIKVGNIVVANTTISTSTTTGALIVRGGAGIAGNVYTNSLYVTSDIFWAGNNVQFTANSANWMYVVESTDDNVAYDIPYLSPTGVANAYKRIYSDATGITFNPSTNTLTTTDVRASGALYTAQGVYWSGNGQAFTSTTLANTNEITANISSGQNVGLNLTTTGVVAGNYGSATSIPTIVVDSKGRITGVTSNAVSTTITLAGGSGSGSVAGGGTLTVAGTSNQITTAVGGSTITIALAQNVTAPGNLTVTGNLVVQGNTTTLNTETLTIEDLNITVANGAVNAAAADGAGITVGGANARLLYKSATNSWVFDQGVFASGNLVANSTTTSTSTTTGALVVTGGAGISGALYTGGIINAAGNIVADSGVASTSTTTGALIVNGGAGIAGNLNVGSGTSGYKATFASPGAGTSGVMFIGAALNSSGNGLVISSTTRTVSDNAVPMLHLIARDGTVALSTTVQGNTVIGSSTTSTSTTTGALVVAGGVGIGGNINIGGSGGNAIVTTNDIYTTANVKVGDNLRWAANGQYYLLGYTTTTVAPLNNITDFGAGESSPTTMVDAFGISTGMPVYNMMDPSGYIVTLDYNA